MSEYIFVTNIFEYSNIFVTPWLRSSPADAHVGLGAKCKEHKEASQDWASSSDSGVEMETDRIHWLDPSSTGNGDGFERALTDPAQLVIPALISISLVQLLISTQSNWWTQLMEIEHFPYRETPAPRAICKSRAYRSQVPNPLYEVGNFKSVGESAKAHRCNQIEEEKMSGLVSGGAALLTTPFHLFTPISIQSKPV